MTSFVYEGFNRHGKKERGVYESPSLHEAKESLYGSGIYISSIAPAKERGKDLSLSELYVLTLQLSQMLSAGLTIYDSVMTLAEYMKHERTGQMMALVAQDIKEGKSLSEALLRFSGTFDESYRALCHAGEATGRLEGNLTELAQSIDRRMKIQGQVLSSLTYPIVLLIFSAIVIVVLLFFVVPMLQELFDVTRINALTRYVFWFSDWVRSWGLYLFAAFCAFVSAGFFYIKTPLGRWHFDRILLQLPFISTLVQKAALARFCSAMATGLCAGLNLLDALRLSVPLLGNKVYIAAFEKAALGVVEGKTLSDGLLGYSFFPTIFLRMLAVGEQSGRLDVLFGHLSHIFRDELERVFSRFTALAAPLILIVLGALVGMILLAVLLPMMDISQLSS